eukprot:c25611_g1_i1.p1 GENE.c25611_g1_i1~~c25611_g1_i1.p1  ORF type:complete len:228 (+),score=47.42 c25611_g1_i1:35-685(+)
MDTLLGVVGDGFVILAADAGQLRSIMRLKDDEDKIYPLDSNKLLGVVGECGDRTHFAENIQKNLALYTLRNDEELSTAKAASFIRSTMAKALREAPYQANCLIAGYDAAAGPSLYFMDYLGALQKVNFGAQGYASHFTLAIFDRMWRPKMSEGEAMAVLEACMKELAKRFIVGMPDFFIKIVDANGVRILRSSDAFAYEKSVVAGPAAAGSAMDTA